MSANSAALPRAPRPLRSATGALASVCTVASHHLKLLGSVPSGVGRDIRCRARSTISLTGTRDPARSRSAQLRTINRSSPLSDRRSKPSQATLSSSTRSMTGSTSDGLTAEPASLGAFCASSSEIASSSSTRAARIVFLVRSRTASVDRLPIGRLEPMDSTSCGNARSDDNMIYLTRVYLDGARWSYPFGVSRPRKSRDHSPIFR